MLPASVRRGQCFAHLASVLCVGTVEASRRLLVDATARLAVGTVPPGFRRGTAASAMQPAGQQCLCVTARVRGEVTVRLPVRAGSQVSLLTGVRRGGPPAALAVGLGCPGRVSWYCCRRS